MYKCGAQPYNFKNMTSETVVLQTYVGGKLNIYNYNRNISEYSLDFSRENVKQSVDW